MAGFGIDDFCAGVWHYFADGGESPIDCVVRKGVEACGRSFASEQGLHSHELWCTHFAAPDLSLTSLADRLAAKRAEKRRRRDTTTIVRILTMHDVLFIDKLLGRAPSTR